MYKLDHLAISATSLDTGVADVSRRFGVPFQPGGQHVAMGTHNQLLALGDLYLEVIAIDPKGTAPARPRWFDLDRFSGPARVTNWILRCADIDAGLTDLPDGTGVPLALGRGDLRWQMAVPETGLLPLDGVAPALIAWDGTAHPVQRLQDHGVRLKRLEVSHPDIAALPVLEDRRIVYRQAPRGLFAVFETPNGEVSL